ncbi:hypothetical protein PF005_g10770 [Phytophthora fragariae]|uniref:Uncharacterized protein n=1 Tax=Phytophthora fragariae TaxID=53985 RepID=A0A6A3S7A5_9STRA|nr:hypothetical protein PF003_g7608 [Phytophthora fragariae]KAE8937343.1 hypothetical protein PF009_g12750 [Phytophthora fragariae]KAE9008377.1 hypothetical protein PF011_g10728 [Phytophthora fragariae]KAE9111324.1 hypothetical protein PF007_g11522 [Phytophthora fragariae]KAE9149970.1 hypothetical protein PF006_g5591 [Phytophthora fragariae]
MTKNADIRSVLFAALPAYYCTAPAKYEADCLAHTSSHAGSLDSFGFVNDKLVNFYQWMECLVDRNMPLSSPSSLDVVSQV